MAIIKGLLSQNERDTIIKAKQFWFGEDASRIHSSFVLSKIIVETSACSDKISKLIKEDKTLTSIEGRTETSYRLNATAHDKLIEMARQADCSLIAAVRGLLFFKQQELDNNGTDKESVDCFSVEVPLRSNFVFKAELPKDITKEERLKLSNFIGNLYPRTCFRISSWNINARAQCNKIPDFVLNEAKNNSDIFVFVEAFNLRGQIQSLKEKMAEFELYYIDKEPAQFQENEVLIGIRRNIEDAKLPTKEEFLKMPQLTCNDNTPDFLRVDIEIANKPLTIIGVRIVSDIDKIKQIQALNKHLENIKESFICIGDFNVWPSWLKKQNLIPVGFVNAPNPEFLERGNFKTLQKFSYVFEKEDKAPLDFILANGTKVESIDYSWGFLNKTNGYGKKHPNEYKSSNELIGLPDHAILTAEISL